MTALISLLKLCRWNEAEGRSWVLSEHRVHEQTHKPAHFNANKGRDFSIETRMSAVRVNTHLKHVRPHKHPSHLYTIVHHVMCCDNLCVYSEKKESFSLYVFMTGNRKSSTFSFTLLRLCKHVTSLLCQR